MASCEPVICAACGDRIAVGREAHHWKRVTADESIKLCGHGPCDCPVLFPHDKLDALEKAKAEFDSLMTCLHTVEAERDAIQERVKELEAELDVMDNKSLHDSYIYFLARNRAYQEHRQYQALLEKALRRKRKALARYMARLKTALGEVHAYKTQRNMWQKRADILVAERDQVSRDLEQMCEKYRQVNAALITLMRAPT